MDQSETTRKTNYFSALLLCFLTATLLSCVSEDELNLPDEDTDSDFTESVAIISVLRAIDNEFLSEESCFQFQFPLELKFNNELTISISDFAGLKELANNAISDQHISAVEFPISAVKNSVTRSIANEDDFIELLDDCQLLTLRDEFDHVYTQCFDFIYPIQMLDADNNVVSIDNKESYFDFEAIQGFDEQPRFIYPLSLLRYSAERNIVIENTFSMFEIIDSCSQCPDLRFQIDTLLANRFLFEADFERKNEIVYGWYINDVKVEEDGGPIGGDNKIVETLAPGDYKICMRTSLPQEDCFTGTEYCKEITVLDSCPLLSFTTQARDNFTYEFIADFMLKNEIDYWWNIYQNDQVIFSAPSSEVLNNKLIYEFNSGNYVICIETETPECPQGTNFCTALTIP